MERRTPTLAETIEAPLNYLAPTDETPYSYTHDPPPGIPVRVGDVDRRIVTIRNGRPIAGRLSLDREGLPVAPPAGAGARFSERCRGAAGLLPRG